MLDSSKFLDDEEDAKLKALVRSDKSEFAVAFDLLRKYGMRSNELLAICAKDIDPKRRVFRVRGSKGSRPREFPLDKERFEKLWALARTCLNDSDPVFPFNYRRLQHRWDQWKTMISPIGRRKKIHSLRHTCAIELYRKTKDIRLVQNVLGHRSLTNTMIYLDFVSSADEFKKAFLEKVG